MAKDKKSKIDIYDESNTLADYFKLLEVEDMRRLERRKKQEAKAADAYNKAIESALSKNEKNREVLSKRYAEIEYEIRHASEKKLEEERKKERLKAINSIYAKEVENIGKFGKIRRKQDEDNVKKEAKERLEENKAWLKEYKKLQSEGIELTQEQLDDMKEREKERDLGQITAFEDFTKNLTKGLTKGLFDMANKFTSAIDSTIEKYTSYQLGINARLQGAIITGNEENSQNYFSVLEKNLQSSVGVTPFFSTQVMLDNLQSLVDAGISSNLEQRAFLATLKDDIATTFDAANGSLLRLIRLQQSDSTAMRLGMEAYLTRFLNNLVMNTEYLTSTYDNVEQALVEASSLMSETASSELEFVVQKWLGALTGVGLSETTAQNLATAIGQLGSGDITNLTNTNLFNLVSRASSQSGLSIDEMLKSGVTAEDANALMRSIVDYMIDIGSNSSNVVKSQMASTFGVSVSDLVAATNLSDRLTELTNEMKYAEDMYSELGYQLGALNERIPEANKLDTYFENLEFSLGSNIARNPAMAAVWKVNSMIEQATGGINIPTIGALGNFVDLNANINQLAKLAMVGIGSMGKIGDVISGISSSIMPSMILNKLNINPGATTIVHGEGLSSRTSGMTTSRASYVGSSDGELMTEGILSQANEQAKEISVAPTTENAENLIPEIHDYLLTTLEAHMSTIDESIVSLRNRIENGTVSVHDDSMSELIDGINRMSIV